MTQQLGRAPPTPDEPGQRADHPQLWAQRVAAAAGEAAAWREESGPVPAGTTAGAEETEEAPAVPETLRKREGTSQRDVCPPRCFRRPGGSLCEAGNTGGCPDRRDRLGGREAGDVFVLARPRLAGGIRSRAVHGVSLEVRRLCSFSPSPAPVTGTQPHLGSRGLGSVAGGPPSRARVALRLPPCQ